ncbi:MAG: ABC transporter substrate-binding protein, partial [Candidatus Paceibacterota bacterium]
TRYSYEVIFEDDQLRPSETATAANKLVNIDNVDVLISTTSGSGNVISPIANENQVLHIGIASDANIANGFYNFIHWTPPSEENKVFIEELKRRDITKLGIFEVNQQGVAAVTNDLEEKLEGTGIEVVTKQAFNFGETDFRSIISKARDGGAEIYLLLAFSPEVEILARQIKEIGIETPLTSIESFEFTEQKDLFEGEWYVNGADPSDSFANEFELRAGTSPTPGAANGYDAFNLIVSASENIRQSTKPTSDQIIEELLKINNFSGALGDLYINEDGIVISEAVVRMIQDGKPVTIR